MAMIRFLGAGRQSLVSLGRSDRGSAAPPIVLFLSLVGAAAIAGGVIVAALFLLLAVRSAILRRRRDPDTPAAAAPSVDLPSPSLQTRVDATRKRLWWTLLRDSNLMLKNRLKVRHLMTSDLLTVAPSTSVDEMADVMRQSKVRHLLVCHADGRLMGIVSNRDLGAHRGRTAREVMTPSPHTVSRETSIDAAITCLISKHVSCLPVVDRGRPCGVVTTTDLVLALQCTLQLWLRVAQAVQSDAQWEEQLERMSMEIDGDLADQQARLAKLKDQLAELESANQAGAFNTLSSQAGEVLDASAHLAHEIAATHTQMRQHTQQLVNLIDLGTDSQDDLSGHRELPGILEMMPTIKKGEEEPFSLAVVAIAHLGTIRNEYGAVVATKMLRAVAELIVDRVRSSDIVARCEDDTFVIILPRTDHIAANCFCRGLQTSVQQDWPLEIPVKLRTGAVTSLGDESSSTLLARAEAALSA